MSSPDARQELAATLSSVRELSRALQQKADDLACERQRRFERFEFAPDACVLTDAHGRVVEVNRAGRELLGPQARPSRALAPWIRRSKGINVHSVVPLYGGHCWRLRAAP